ncbi:MAG: hypothetical protein JNJ54_26450 [Myxococcaceae bacterium]|nr:hypothetical protein [Myxococcaceae bacterium]
MRLLAILCAVVLVACATATAPAPTLPEKKPKGSRWVVRPVEGLGLFKDEREQSARLVAAWLEEKGYRIADAATLEALAQARQGRSALTGQDCGRPLATFEAARRWGSALGLAGSTSASVWCGKGEGPCQLSVSGAPLTADDRFRFVGPLARSGSPLEALAAAVTGLAPPAPPDGGVVGDLFGALGRREVRRGDELELRVSSADWRVPADQLPGPALTLAQALTCLGADSDHATLLLQVDGAGVTSRCESAFELDRPEQTSCLCAQVARAGAQTALAGKRWSVSFTIRRADRLTRDDRLVLSAYWNTRIVRVRTDRPFPRFEERVEDPSLEGWSPAPARLAATCFEGVTAPGRIPSRWAVWFDARGNATKAQEQKGYAPLDPVTRECVARALLTSQAPCPSRGGLWAMADLQVTLSDPSQKPDNVFGPGGLGTGLEP